MDFFVNYSSDKPLESIYSLFRRFTGRNDCANAFQMHFECILNEYHIRVFQN